MSQENMKVVRNACEAWARGDFEMSYASWHPDIEWDTTRATARSRASTTTPTERRPSKPWGWRSSRIG